MQQLTPLNVALGFLAALALGAIAYRKKVVDPSGFLAGVTVGSVVCWMGGWAWFALLTYFFVTSSVFTKLGYGTKSRWGAAQEKGGARTLGNVIANGAVPAAAATLSFVTGGYPLWSFVFIGAISTATADTIATEVGLLSESPPRLVTKPWIVVPHGTSGGVSFLGTTAATLSAAGAGVLSLLMGAHLPAWRVIAIAVASGIIGCFVDSVLGATIEGHYKCIVCGCLTEKNEHHGRSATLVKGIRVVDNNVVNLLSTAAGALVSAALAASA